MQEGDFFLSFSIFLLLFCFYTVQVLCAGKSNEGVVQVLLNPVHVLQLPPPPIYHKYWSLSNSYLHFITSTGPCPKIIFPISQVLACSTVTSTISQELDPVLKLPPLYHKYQSLSYRYLPIITSSGPCPTDTSPLSQALVPVLQIPPLYHKL